MKSLSTVFASLIVATSIALPVVAENRLAANDGFVAGEKLDIEQDSSYQFVGSYQADKHRVSFDTSMTKSAVKVMIEIDGTMREARFDLDKTYLKLIAGNTEVTEIEKELMYDAAKTLVEYVNKQQTHELNDHLVVLVGVMNDWSSISTIN